MKLSFFEQCIEIFTSMEWGTCKNRTTDQTVHQKWSILAGYVENGLLYTNPMQNILWYAFIL